MFSTVEAPGDDTAKCECVGFDGAFTVTPKYKPFTRIINNCQNTADWNTHSLSNCETDAENYILGNQSIHSTNGAMVCMKNTYDMLNNNLVLKLRINSIATGANLYLQIFNTATPSKSVVYNLMRGASTTPVGEWREIAVPYTGYSWGSFDSVDFSNINYLRIYAEGDVDWNLQFVGTRPIVLDKGIVTFTFDDGYASQGTGLKMLAEKGITGTLFYVPESNSNGSDDYLKISDLQNLSNYYGTDIDSQENLIACHLTTDRIAELIGADTLGYLPLESLDEITGGHGCCTACFSGAYPTPIPLAGKNQFEQRLSEVRTEE